MTRWRISGVASLLALVAAGALAVRVRGEPPVAPSVGDLAGRYWATLESDGDTTPFGLEIEPAPEGKAALFVTIPAIHVERAAFGTVAIEARDGRVGLGSFTLDWNPADRTLSGVVPEGLAPVYRIALRLRRDAAPVAPVAPAPLAGRLATPRWTFDAGSPLWAGATFADGAVYAGAVDGRVHALEAASGEKRWSFAAAGEVRVRPTVADGVVYFQSDDGLLHALSAASGEERWQVRVVPGPVVRLPFDDPKSRYDRFGSDVTTANGRLYLGTHAGRVLCLDPASGAVVWEFGAADAVLAAPAVAAGRVFAGSFDGHVYALDERTGRLLWKHDARAPVVSTPAVHDGRVIVGTRAYDLLALDAATGAPRWRRYMWFSWVESSPAVRDGIVYVGSSDAAAVFAFEAATGRRVWKADVLGWAWGQPAVTARHVFVGTSSQAGYPSGHRAGVVALDRATGAVAWSAPSTAPPQGAFGYPGSATAGDGLVFVTGLDGRVAAFPED